MKKATSIATVIYYIITSIVVLTVTETPGTFQQSLQCHSHEWFRYLFDNKSCLKDVQYLSRHMSCWSFAQEQLTLNFPIDKEKRNYVRQVNNVIFSVVKPTQFKSEVKLGAFSSEVLEELMDMHPSIINSTDFVNVVSGNFVLGGSTPLAHRYGGHQFGVWADQLGDGRAHLLGEYVSQKGIRWELQLKGSGLTPYSRRGDGRAVIRSSVREFLASEAMFHLGIPTSRAATLVVSKDRIIRDKFYNGNHRHERCAVVLRLAQSWFRFGSLEILAKRGETQLLRKLVDFVIHNYFPMIDINDADRYLALYSDIVSATAQMIAKWQAVGFAHGVCNTDNFSLLSITIDYGPFRFMDEYDPDMVPNTSDDEGRYRFRRQPDVGHFNLQKLLMAISPLLTLNQRQQMEIILKGYMPQYKAAWTDILGKKLGISDCESETAETVIELLFRMMKDTAADFTMTFRQIGDWTHDNIKEIKVPKKLWSLYSVSKHKYFQHWAKEYWNCVKSSKQTETRRRAEMHRNNPRYVLRNWIAQKAISAAEKGDFTVINEIHELLKNPYKENVQAELAGYADPPPHWAKGLRVSCSS